MESCSGRNYAPSRNRLGDCSVGDPCRNYDLSRNPSRRLASSSRSHGRAGQIFGLFMCVPVTLNTRARDHTHTRTNTHRHTHTHTQARPTALSQKLLTRWACPPFPVWLGLSRAHSSSTLCYTLYIQRICCQSSHMPCISQVYVFQNKKICLIYAMPV